MDGRSAGIGAFTESSGGLEDEVRGVNGDAGKIAFEGISSGGRLRVEHERVAPLDWRDKTDKVVKTIRASTGDGEKEVDFGWSEQTKHDRDDNAPTAKCTAKNLLAVNFSALDDYKFTRINSIAQA